MGFDKEGIINYRDYQFDYGYHRFVYKRQWLLDNDIYFPPYARFQDPPFFVKAMITAGKFYAIDKIVYAYRVSHKVLQWNATKANDMLCGMLDLLNYANMYNLEKLRYYTGLRLSYNYSRSKGKYDTQCLTTLIKLCRAYVRFSTRHKLFSIKRLWNSKVRLVTIFGKSFIWDRT